MSVRSKRELLAQVAPRYREAGGRQKSAILDEFVSATGYARKYAIRLLNGPPPPATEIRRPRARRYGPVVQDALAFCWAATNHICAKRLVPFLDELVASLERHGHLRLTNVDREQLLAMSPSTADRILQSLRKASLRGASTTKAGKLLKHQVPVRTFSDWEDTRPGFMEADLVAHCGTSTSGPFLSSLVLTDVATGWTECFALLHAGKEAVIQGLEWARRLLPFPLLGIDTDNGSEFINHAVIEFCEQVQITFTRGRPYKKNDQCFVEQKNGSIVRQVVGYDRYEGTVAHRQLSELYRGLRLFVNVFQPSMKLREKRRDGAKVRRLYDSAQTPLQRVLLSHTVDVEARERLQHLREALDPVQLLRQIRTLQDALWRHAHAAATPTATGEAVHFDPGVCLPGSPGPDRPVPAAEDLVDMGRRKYRQTKRPRKPRTYRTRVDPFEAVRDDLVAWFAEAPDRTAQSMLHQLQTRHPGQYSDKLLRTLQRRVQEWRAAAVLTFEVSWLDEDLTASRSHPASLRAVPAEAHASYERVEASPPCE